MRASRRGKAITDRVCRTEAAQITVGLRARQENVLDRRRGAGAVRLATPGTCWSVRAIAPLASEISHAVSSAEVIVVAAGPQSIFAGITLQPFSTANHGARATNAAGFTR